MIASCGCASSNAVCVAVASRDWLHEYVNRSEIGITHASGLVLAAESLETELGEKRKEKGQDEERGSGFRIVRAGRPRRTVWAGGIRRFEKEGLVFESGETPVILGAGYLEWIDPDPAADQSDMKIESEKEEKATPFGVKITTDGFTLEAEKARIEWSKDVVKIFPMPK